METISSIDKKLQFSSAHDHIQSHYLKNYSQQQKQSTNYLNPFNNQKSSFLRYASSLIEVGIQDEIDHQLQVYEESQLINPPQSLILKYQSLQKDTQFNDSCKNYQNKSLQKNIIQGIQKLNNFFQHQSHKKNFKKTFNSSQTLINILVLSSVQNFTQNDQKFILEQAFHQLKFLYNNFKANQKLQRPLLPKRSNFVNQNQRLKTSIMLLCQNKKQGVQQIAGSLTFKVLQIEAQCFSQLKSSVLKLKLQSFINKIKKVYLRNGFKNIFQYLNNFNPSKYDSKILTLSRSKSKGSMSKIKIRNLKSNSQKKITIKRLNSHQYTDLSVQCQENFSERIINSEILSDFDFTQLQSNVNDEQRQIETQKKMQFNNRLKKKSIKQSASQAETLNSLRSLQSEEYQFTGGAQSSKVSSSIKPISIRNFHNGYQNQQDEDLPTQKMIHHNVKKKKTSFETKLYHPTINQAKQISLFCMKERRYMNVRTNLFEHPIQLDVEKQIKKNYHKEQMTKIYHLKPEHFIKSEVLTDENDNLLTSIKSINLSSYFKDSHKQRNTNPQQKKSQYQSLQNKISEQHINKHQKIKTKKLGKDNFQEYYFKAQINQNLKQNTSTKVLKNQRNINIKPSLNQNRQVSGSKEFYQTEYRSSKKLQPSNVKIMKSLSPKMKVSLHSPYRTGKLGNRLLSKSRNNQTLSGQSESLSKMSLQKFGVNPSNFFPLQINSSVNTPTNIHQFAPKIQPSQINTQRSVSKLKVFSNTARSLSPQQNNILPHFLPAQTIERKVSFITNGIPHTVTQQQINRPASNTVHFIQQGSTFVPTISNLSNQSKYQTQKQNINQVINYGSHAGVNQQFVNNRPQSILSTHSNQSKQKRIHIMKPSQVMMSPTQRLMHGIQSENVVEKAVVSPRNYLQGNQSPLPSDISQKRGLNVVIRNNHLIQPQKSPGNLNYDRQKVTSNQKLFITQRR